ncbi:Predicted branched-chain amino acid permease (azaleucine resistance) [Loktanella fryxellensis]|uniref:Predicted branched-chain amino acid permease (Azaleucine resistance) n=1 Tax=Loktanella fryxellensis TaxID=245187 RepID=A0A1H8FI79_9RHOB|nr:AzlC family ABC transporter permease [Loktanella fryxellensis]SEN31571.1 Predicted branched-chain amino acid permease (azaleucine resistance) [Loktanella fryxellensis]
MPAATSKSVYWQGVRAGGPFILVVVPFSLLFGVAATEAGLTLAQAMGFSVLVIAGGSQFAALQMMVDQAGIALVLLAALAVNLRMAMYSASLAPYLGTAPLWQRAVVAYTLFDQTYLASITAYDAQPAMSIRDRFDYFMGVATPITPVWCAMTAVGALAGTAIPPAAALDFALPITFLAMVAPMLRSLPHLAAAGTSAVVALVLNGLPAGTGLLIASACAMAVGVLVEKRT